MTELSLRPHEMVAEFCRLTKCPTQAQIDALKRRGISTWGMAGAPGTGEFGVGFARVSLLADGHFDFDPDGQPGMVVIGLDEFGDPADLVGWPLKDAWIATWYGRISMLGVQTVLAPRMSEALQIFPNAFEWLRGERDGIVLIDEPRACRELRDFGPFLAAGGIAHGEHLRALMTPAPPVILVPVRPERRAA